MHRLLCLFFVSAASAAMILPYNDGSGSSSIGSGSTGFQGSGSSGFQGSNDNYGTQQETRCTPYFENVQREQCEDYTERTCTTTQRESCQDIGDQNCRAVVSSKQVRKCFNVTEQRCTLKEDVQLDTIQVPIVVQKCQRVNERVCDTVYDTSSSQKENSECINLENPHCENVDNTVFDTTCRTTTQFDCDTSYPDSYAAGGAAGGAGAGAGAGSAGGYGGNNNNDAYSTDSSYGSTTNAYGQARVNCRRKQDTKCYKTPRTVTVQQCSRRSERVCESVRVASPFVTARQSCRNEEKRVCDLEERTQPKQVKRYTYSKQCNAVPRTVCENADQKTLVPSCVGVTRKQCSYSPVENCSETPKQHCFQVNQKVRKQRCETVTVGGYGSGSGNTGTVVDQGQDY